MNNTWYELEIVQLIPDLYENPLYDLSDENAGFDIITATDVHVINTLEMIPLGISVRMLKVELMPHGTSNDYLKTESHFWLAPRSSIFKHGIIMANSVGVIDKTYRGELKAPVWSMTGDSTIAKGTRLFQIVAPDMGWIRHVRFVDALPSTKRGANGFGSSGA
jgi:dUTPase